MKIESIIVLTNREDDKEFKMWRNMKWDKKITFWKKCYCIRGIIGMALIVDQTRSNRLR